MTLENKGTSVICRRDRLIMLVFTGKFQRPTSPSFWDMVEKWIPRTN